MKHNFQFSIFNYPLTFALLSALMLTGCSETEFQGDEELLAQADSVPVLFATEKDAVTRGTTKNMEAYEGTMMVFSVKKTSSGYLRALNRYAIWNTSNDVAAAGDWEYVGSKDETKTVVKDGKAGTANNFTILQNQVLKFWDYSSAYYIFWAWAPYKDYYMDNSASGSIKTNIYTDKSSSNYNMVRDAYLYDIDGHLTANTTTTPSSYYKFYVADPVRVNKEDYGSITENNPVNFSFKEIHAKVRTAFYETIPNYKVVGIKFYNNTAGTTTADADANNIVFTRTNNSFIGGKSGEERTYAKIIYDNTALSYSITYYEMNSQNWIQLGKLALSETSPMVDASVAYNPSWGTDGDMASDYYFTVLPTPTNMVDKVDPIVVMMDLTLKAEDSSGEVIKVQGVSGMIPPQYSTWKPNYAYSYVFKITSAAINLKKIEFDAEASSIIKDGGEKEIDMEGK